MDWWCIIRRSGNPLRVESDRIIQGSKHTWVAASSSSQRKLTSSDRWKIRRCQTYKFIRLPTKSVLTWIQVLQGPRIKTYAWLSQKMSVLSEFSFCFKNSIGKIQLIVTGWIGTLLLSYKIQWTDLRTYLLVFSIEIIVFRRKVEGKSWKND